MAKELEIEVVAMSCNLKDPFQKRIYDHAKNRSNSSAYLKSLVIQDMLGIPMVENKRESSVSDVNSFI